VHKRSTDSIRELQNGNELAGRTFQINNALQEIVNDINTLEVGYQNLSNLPHPGLLAETGAGISRMRKNTDLLIKLTAIFKNNDVVNRFSSLINKKINFFKAVSASLNTGINAEKTVFSDQSNILNDSIYVSALSIQIKAESELQAKINQNFTVSKRALFISKALTLLAISAILLLATIIILHLLRNHRLIKTIELSKKEVDIAAGVKEQFLANMSHEIRTPVNSIIGFTSLLQKTSLQKDQSDFVSYIKNSGENLLYIVNDILDISKIEAGMLHIKKEPFNINELCYNIEMMFYNESRSKQIAFNYSIGKEVPEFIVGDEDRLKQILANLIGNAFKFTHHGSISLGIKAENEKPGFLNLVFKIKDTGIGIPEEKIDTIFERFEQANSKTTKTYGGTGLGLSIVKKLVTMQGGKITVLSKENAGSEFIFSLPLQIAEEININELKTQPFDTEANSCEMNFPSKFKILAAEDNKMNQLLLQHIFKQWNLNFKIANNGAQVIDILKTETFDVILMDIQMPDIDGYLATNFIRKELKSNVPVIAMTAYVLPAEKEKCFAFGMNEYLPKPINEVKLRELLVKYLPAETVNKKAPLINQAHLLETFSKNKGFIKNILELFITQLPADLAALKQAVTERNCKQVKTLAHHLKSTVLSVNPIYPDIADLQKLEESDILNPDWININELTDNLLKTETTALNEAEEFLKKL
jgi:signal transduction histidine kinase/DNA-binding response OmpR family regulator